MGLPIAQYICTPYLCRIIHGKKQVMKNHPIGAVKSKKVVNCEICSCALPRSAKVYFYENTPKAIGMAKKELFAKLTKPYVCKICKSISDSAIKKKRPATN